jgi:hypothetical protein
MYSKMKLFYIENGRLRKSIDKDFGGWSNDWHPQPCEFLHPHSPPVIGPSCTYFAVFRRSPTSCK